MDGRADRLGRRTRLAAVAERYEIAFLYLFGSRAADFRPFLRRYLREAMAEGASER